ncbi:histidine phosphatase family protein [Pseudohalocynthiibacter aestuariivivens]|nr:histidine phosphatase family protein [Pseudohalocynthiibacter aestuariivivens]QIE46667.1 histidine phosphatase family protein [Pseudohalocynthiibacter aestuariivivens]
MTRRLILIRHAKSSWDVPVQNDHARTLNDRGRRAATALGTWLRREGYVPDAILSSSSERTRETAARLGFDVPSEYTNALYHAGPRRMRAALNGATASCVLMLGHNPGIAEFADLLVDKHPNHPRFLDYPTGATLVVDFPIESWEKVELGTGHVVDFVIPRELSE